MSALTAVSRREFFSYVLSPSGYVITAVFLLFGGLLMFLIGSLYGGGFAQGQAASMRLFFSGGIWAFLFVAPAISMKTMSEEFRAGSYEMLMSCPVREWQVTVGKFIGSIGFLLLMLVPTLLYVLALESYGRPDYGELACGYLGMALCGAAFLATGLFFSTLTNSQVVAYLVTLFFWLSILLAAKGLPLLAAISESSLTTSDADTFSGWWMSWAADLGRAFGAIDPQNVVRDFASGLVDTFNIVYLLAMTGVALAAAVISLQLRRWR